MDWATAAGRTNLRRAGIAFAILLILGGPFYPWIIGVAVASKITKGQDEAVGKVPYIIIVERSYRRGWFSSEQTVTFELSAGLARSLGAVSKISDPPIAATPASVPSVRFTLRSVIHHGPLLGSDGVGMASIDTHIVTSEATRAALAKIFGNQEALGLHSRLSLFGGSSTLITSPAFKDAAPDQSGMKLSSDGLRVKIAGDSHINHFTMSGGAPRFVITNGDGATTFSMTGLTVDADMRRLLGLIYAGTMTFRIGDISGGMAADRFSVRALSFAETITQRGELYDLAAKMDAGAIELPQWRARDAHFDFTLARLHTATMAQLQEANQQNLSLSNGDTARAVAGMMDQYRKYGLQLLQHDPELHIDQFGFTTPDGTLSLKGVIKTSGIVAADLQANAPAALLPKLSAELDFSASEQLLNRLLAARGGSGTQLEPMITQGIVRRESGNFVSHVEFRDSKLRANGKSIWPPGG